MYRLIVDMHSQLLSEGLEVNLVKQVLILSRAKLTSWERYFESEMRTICLKRGERELKALTNDYISAWACFLFLVSTENV